MTLACCYHPSSFDPRVRACCSDGCNQLVVYAVHKEEFAKVEFEEKNHAGSGWERAVAMADDAAERLFGRPGPAEGLVKAVITVQDSPTEKEPKRVSFSWDLSPKVENPAQLPMTPAAVMYHRFMRLIEVSAQGGPRKEGKSPIVLPSSARLPQSDKSMKLRRRGK